MSTPDEGDRTLRLIAAVVAAEAAGWASFEVAPLVVSALMDAFSFDEAAAGGLASAELIALAVAMLASAGSMARHSRARLGLAGAVIAIAGHVASSFAVSYPLLLSTRMLAGLGAGLAFAAGSAAAAGARQPERVFAIAALAGGVGGALLLAGLPYATVAYGPPGAFVALAAVATLALPFIGWLPAPARQRAGGGVGPAPHRGMALRGLVAVAFLAVGEGAVWAFAGRIAESAGLSVMGAGRVLAMSSLLGQEYGCDDQTCFMLDLAARLHDIGKIGIPDGILLKPDRLSEAEREIMKTHATVGAELLAQSEMPHMQMAEDIARFHHEWWDGSGYPNGIGGAAIPIAARITALSDVFDALTHRRPYKEPWPVARALDEIAYLKGHQFDPELTDLFLALVRRLQREVGDLDEYLGQAARLSPFIRAREKIASTLRRSGGRDTGYRTRLDAQR